MKWIICEHCEEEFRVVCDSDAIVQYCPLCGEILPEDEDEEEYEDE